MTDDATYRKMKQERDLALAECERLRATLRKVYALVGQGGGAYEIYHRVDPVIRDAIDAARAKP